MTLDYIFPQFQTFIAKQDINTKPASNTFPTFDSYPSFKKSDYIRERYALMSLFRRKGTTVSVAVRRSFRHGNLTLTIILPFLNISLSNLKLYCLWQHGQDDAKVQRTRRCQSILLKVIFRTSAPFYTWILSWKPNVCFIFALSKIFLNQCFVNENTDMMISNN